MKKRNYKSILSLLLALFMFISFSVMTYAAKSGVTFENGKLIAFEPGSVYTDTDLFDNFKDVMPGDVRTEEITIQNNTKDCDYIKVYLRAIIHDETGNPISEKVLDELQTDGRREAASELEYMHDFLSQLSMKVRNGSTLIYEEFSDKQDGLAENVYLGSIRKGKTLKLNVELDVPIEMGNEYSSRIGEVDWAFVIEGFDDPMPPPEDDTKPTVHEIWKDNGIVTITNITTLIQTGQLRWPIPVLGSFGFLLIVYGFIGMNKKRKNEHD